MGGVNVLHTISYIRLSATPNMTDIVQNEFQNDWWEFWKDINVCLMGYFCCPCQVCSTGKKLDKSSCLYCLLFCCNLGQIATVINRKAVRERYGIDGSDMEDWLLGCCCSACVSCQTAAELKIREG